MRSVVLFCCIFLCACLAFVAEPSSVIYVAPNGNDAWSGSLESPNADKSDGPVATLERARDALRELRKVALLKPGSIEIRVIGGAEYARTTSFTLGAEDGGSEQMPIVYTSFGATPAVMSAGKKIESFAPPSEDIAKRLASDEARAHVVACNLKAAGITDYGTLKRLGFGMGAGIAPLEVFADGKPLTLARWPNDDWAKIAAVPAGKDGGKFTYDGDQPSKWKFHDDIWVHGYWTWDWADSSEKVASINLETKEIATLAPHGVYGYKEGARYFVFNVLEELDRPGEYYVDRTTGMLYVWPPDNTRTMHVSLAEQPMFKIDGASYITIRGFTVEYTRGDGAVVSNSNHVTFQDCTFANLGDGGISIGNCTDSGVLNCEMYNLGAGGISISGGDRNTLTPARLFANNNEIHDFGRRARTYTAAVHVNGVGNTVSHNLIYNAPHMAIGLGGNDHIIEYNEVHHVCMETHDAGAFYMGRDWTQRGNIVRYNFMHEMGNGDVQAIYLDDWTSGVMVYGNICHGARRGVLVGGGRDNIIDNNIFVNCGTCVHIDQRGLGWAKNYFNGETPTLFDRMKDVKGDQPPYTDKYPELKTLLNDEPALAKGNKVIHNINVGDNFLDLTDGLTEETPYLEIKDNFTEGDPGFLDAAKHDYRLKPDSPAFAKGFKELPFDKMGRNGPSILK
ncbi:MAG: right-handed parallel beta-helix repeat-containing protein [Candidatus Hydrogenedentes bacterium]|nr:right-handed parallel beta-helix repeat-containing protein [Candidatus Hydrogenedentota bacterium]